MQSKIDKIVQKYNILSYCNVTGYAKTLQKRQRKGQIVEEWVLQIHVSKKLPQEKLRKVDILPKSIEDFHIDVIEVGELKALTFKKKIGETKTDVVRPLVAGISIGNASITAGTLGFFVEKNSPPDQGEIFIMSNAHVLCDEPKNEKSEEIRILQPGAYDKPDAEVVGEYYWHKQLYPLGVSDCSIANGIAKILNAIAYIFRKKTRLIATYETVNNIDFAVARILSNISFKLAFFDVDFPPDKFKFVGEGFAGSDQVGLVCRQKYILAEGYKPVGYDVTDVSVGDIVHKTGRTSCHTSATVITESVFENVNYGSYYVAFDDVIMTSKLLEPGDSGSSVWKEV